MECEKCRAKIPADADGCPCCGWQVPAERLRCTSLNRVFSGRYDFLRLLGVGGFAEVYLARDVLLEREVAVKILLPQHARDAQTVERFLREARLYAKLEHKNIIPIFDTGVVQGNVFITMKYIRGESLKHVLSHQGRIAPLLLPAIARGVAAALGYIHQQGIVHRDIKPANIIVETTTRAVYLADFGIARSESSQTLTQTGMIVGTPHYLSPEQIKGKKIDPRSDIYSLGATLYELASGQPPFRGDSPLEILYQHVNENAVSLAKTVPRIDPVVERIICRCLEKDPARRFQKAEEIMAMLGETEAAPAAPFEKTVLTASIAARPGKTRKILAGLALGASLAGAAYFLWFKNTPPPAAGTAKEIAAPAGPAKAQKQEYVDAGEKKQGQPPATLSAVPQSRPAADAAPAVAEKTLTDREALTRKEIKKSGQDAAATEVAPAAVTGTIRFSSFPAMAEIYLAGEKIGSTEQVFARDFPAGEHLFTFTIPDYQSVEVRVLVASGKTVSAHHRFPPFRSFTITARPFGRVFIDGREYGDTPQTIKLAHGEHLVRLVKNGYLTAERRITVDQTAKNSVFFELLKENKK